MMPSDDEFIVRLDELLAEMRRDRNAWEPPTARDVLMHLIALGDWIRSVRAEPEEPE